MMTGTLFPRKQIHVIVFVDMASKKYSLLEKK